jgi:hypothetical protein
VESRPTRLSAPAALAAVLAGTVAYATLDRGATALPAEARVQVALAVLVVAAAAGVLLGRGLRIGAAPAGWAGLALLAAFAAWTGASLAWSITPDLTWIELNRALAYVLAVVLALVIGSSLPRAIERTALAWLSMATVVALYALAGKAIPGVHISGLLDFDHTRFFSRLREPLGYWNALSLGCVLAVPVAVRVVADQDRRPAARVAGAVAGVVLLATVALTYSRGGLIVLALALGVQLALDSERLRVAAATGISLLGALPAVAVGFARDDLTRDGVALAERTDDGLIFLAALLIGVAIAIAGVRLIARAGDRLSRQGDPRVMGAGRGRRLAVAAVITGLALMAVGSGAASSGFDSFKEVKSERQSDPNRILRTNSGNRWVWWNEAAGAWSDRPLTGHGAGSFPLLHHQYRQQLLEVRQPHSVPLQLLAETGLVGALLALGGVALLTAGAAGRVRFGLRAQRDGVPPGREQRYAVALLAAGSAWLVHIWIDWDWDIPGVTLPVLVFFGVLAARPRGLPGPALPPLRDSALPARAAALALAGLFAAVIAVSAVIPSLATDHTRQARAALAAGDLIRAGRDAEIARRLNPLAVEPVLVAAQAAQRRGRYQRAADLLAEAVHRQPESPTAWFRIAALEYQRGDYAKMDIAARRTQELDPLAFTPRLVFYLARDLGPGSATATGTPLPAGP